MLTHDGDFGGLALLGGQPVVGIVRIRPGRFRPAVTIQALTHLVALGLDPAPPFLIVLEGGHVRLRTWG